MKSLLVLLLVPLFVTELSTIEVLKWPALHQQMDAQNGKIKIVSFWSLGSKPSVDELPHFEQLHRSFGNQVEVILVNVDQPSLLETKINPVLEKSRITSKVILLDEVDANAWIDQVDPSWSGAVPATVVIDQNNNHKLYEKGLTYQELVKIVQDIKKP
ncbi:MAG TPA: redoxin domain-containing protein [Cytophagaceae bacterium]|jgi:thiol-disulfide isomerase/thioredoxin|nr:redoxin domain-containing protein [Cytophagaceae bacterium]